MLLYGCEAWGISNAMRKKSEAAEMWFLRRMLRISWVEHATNESVLQRAGARREFIRNIMQRQMRVLGHVIRDDRLENECVTLINEGRRSRGRPRLHYMNTSARSVGDGLSPVELLQMANSRTKWRRMVKNVPCGMRHFGACVMGFVGVLCWKCLGGTRCGLGCLEVYWLAPR